MSAMNSNHCIHGGATRWCRPLSLVLVCALLIARPSLAAAQAVATPPASATAPAPLDLTRFEAAIVAFETADRAAPPRQGGILFVGSSIFRQWTGLATHMAPLPVVNRAFGGSRTAEQLHYMDRIVLPYRPRLIVYYCGSNDVNANETAEAIAGRYEAFSERVRAALPDTHVYFTSIIKAPQKRDRWHVVDAVNERVRAYSARATGRGYIEVNTVLQDAAGEPLLELYLPDRLHYLPPAYDRMAAAIRPPVERAWAIVARTGAAGSPVRP